MGLTATADSADAGIYEKILGSGHHPLSCALHNRPSSSALHNNTVLIISNDEMEDIIKMIKSHEDSSFLPE